MGHFRTILIILFLLAVPLVSATKPSVPPLIKEVVFLDIDGDSVDEIVVFTDRENYILDIDGNTKEAQNEIEGGRKGVQLPEWVNLDREGLPEYLNITSDGIVVSDENGTLRWEFKRQIANASVSDLDHDGYPEIIYIYPKQYPDMLGVLDGQGNLKFEVRSSTIHLEKLRTKKEKEDRYLLLKTLGMIATSFALALFSSDARKFLKPNKQKIGLMLFFSLFIMIPIGGPIMIPIPVLVMLILSIAGKQLDYFSATAYSIFGAYLFSCTTFVIFERHRQPIRENRTPLIIFIILIAMLIGFWLMVTMFKIILPLFILMVLYYIAKMIKTKFRRS